MDPSNNILSYLTSQLDGILVVDDQKFPVYSIAPRNKEKYVIINNPVFKDDSCYDDHEWEGLITIDILEYFKERGSYFNVNNISDQIQSAIIKKKWSIVNYAIIGGPFLFDSPTSSFEFEHGTEIKKSLIITFKIQKIGG